MKIYIMLGIVFVSLLVGCTPQVPSNIPPDSIIENITYEEEINDSSDYIREEIPDENINIDLNDIENDYINEEAYKAIQVK